MKPFEEAKAVTINKIEKIENPFTTNRILSFSPNTFVAATQINKYVGRLKKEEITSLFNIVVPKSNRSPYFHYIKKNSKNDIVINKISKSFICNQYHAKQIYKILQNINVRPEKLFGIK